MLKDKIWKGSKYEKIENLSILFLFVGSVMVPIGLALTIFSPSGISAILAMIGSLIAFISSLVFIFSLFKKGAERWKEEE